MVDSGTTMLKEYEEFAAEFLAKERNLNDDLPTPPYKEEMGVQTVDTFIRLRFLYYYIAAIVLLRSNDFAVGYASNCKKIHPAFR